MKGSRVLRGTMDKQGPKFGKKRLPCVGDPMAGTDVWDHSLLK